MSSVDHVRDRIAKLRRLITKSNVVEDATKNEIRKQLELLEEKVSNKPISLAEAGGTRLVQFEHDVIATQQAKSSVSNGVGEGVATATMGTATIDANIEFDVQLRKAWDEMCWAARNDMSGEEMLLITEKTMRVLTQAYRCHQPEDVMTYWRFLVKRRQENTATRAACDDVAPPAERNAGAIVASTAKASQRTEALPQGVEAYNYSPDVASPTAAMWTKSPSPDGSSRAGTSTRGPLSRTGTSRIDAKSMRAKTVRSSEPGFTNSAKWVK